MRPACVVGLVAWLAAGSVWADERPRVKHNPFAGPRSVAGGESARTRAEGWTPVLRATSLSGAGGIANLGGVILSVGEQAHGYKLVEVRTGEADFERAGTRITLRVAPVSGESR